MLKEYDDIKEEIKRLKQFIEDFSWFIKQFSCVAGSVEITLIVKHQKL